MSPHIEDTTPTTAILRFSGRRGRPKTRSIKKDTGTPELVMHRLKGETTEALDLLLARELITGEQHWCGIHLRWLYTLRHGAPGVRAVDTTHLGGMEIKADDPEWRQAREKEFHEAIHALGSYNSALLMNLCIYNDRPDCLRNVSRHALKTMNYRQHQLDAIRTALDSLAAHWRSK